MPLTDAQKRANQRLRDFEKETVEETYGKESQLRKDDHLQILQDFIKTLGKAGFSCTQEKTTPATRPLLMSWNNDYVKYNCVKESYNGESVFVSDINEIANFEDLYKYNKDKRVVFGFNDNKIRYKCDPDTYKHSWCPEMDVKFIKPLKTESDIRGSMAIFKNGKMFLDIAMYDYDDFTDFKPNPDILITVSNSKIPKASFFSVSIPMLK